LPSTRGAAIVPSSTRRAAPGEGGNMTMSSFTVTIEPFDDISQDIEAISTTIGKGLLVIYVDTKTTTYVPLVNLSKFTITENE
jgi:hypothetical protein